MPPPLEIDIIFHYLMPATPAEPQRSTYVDDIDAILSPLLMLARARAAADALRCRYAAPPCCCLLMRAAADYDAPPTMPAPCRR